MNKNNQTLNKKDLTRTSMLLSKILRHKALDMGIKIDQDGYVNVQELMQNNKKLQKLSFQELQQIVEENNKKRFQLIQRDNQWYIRATQGHSIKLINDDGLLKLMSQDELSKLTIIHGTFSQFWDPISKTGLNSMARNHIHLAIGYPGEDQVISGMRNTCDIFIEIDTQLASQNGIKFYISENKVVLTRGINQTLSPMYFKKVFQKNDNKKELIFENSNLKELKPLYTFKYLIVLDFEANCYHKGKPKPQEIIEFPAVIIDTQKQQILNDNIFHYYIKPTVTKLTDFATKLTGITEQQLEKGIILQEALQNIQKWFDDNELIEEETCFVTCGDFDFKCLARECQFKQIQYPNFLKKYINIKEVMAALTNTQKSQWSMTKMLDHFSIKLEGKHHSGIDDSKNIASILLHILKSDFLITKNYGKIVEI